jgi:hypothetical protein
MQKSMYRGWQGIAFAIGLTIFLLPSCKDDVVVPTEATINVTVTFDNTELWETWADSGEIQLTFFPEFMLDPLSGWGEVPDDTFGPGSPGGTFPVGAPSSAFTINFSKDTSVYRFALTLTEMTEGVIFSAAAVGFRHDLISAPNLKTASLGVHWGNESEVSYGIVIKPAIGAPPVFDFPAPTTFTVEPGDVLDLNFKADLAFVEVWPFRN